MDPPVAVAEVTVVWKVSQKLSISVVANAVAGVTARAPIVTPAPAVFWPIESHWKEIFAIVVVEPVVIPARPQTSIVRPRKFMNPGGRLMVPTTVGTVVAALPDTGNASDAVGNPKVPM